MGAWDIIKTIGKSTINFLNAVNDKMEQKIAEAKLIQQKEMKSKTDEELLKIASKGSTVKSMAARMELKERGITKIT